MLDALHPISVATGESGKMCSLKYDNGTSFGVEEW